jgi:hypothetical protein
MEFHVLLAWRRNFFWGASSPYPPYGSISSPPQVFSLFGGKSHLTSIIAQERNNRGEENHHNKIDRMGYLGL